MAELLYRCPNCQKKLMQQTAGTAQVAIFGRPVILGKSGMIIKCGKCKHVLAVPVQVTLPELTKSSNSNLGDNE